MAAMRIEGPGRPAPSRAERAKRSARASAFAPAASAAGAEPSAPAAAPVSAGNAGAVGSVDALFALQAVEARPEDTEKTLDRAGKMLEALDDLRMALLEGRAGAGALSRLAAVVEQERGVSKDAELNAAVEAVELRAAVELAKAERDARAPRS